MIYKFEPIYKERVWGGNMFARHLNRSVPRNSKLGESWDIVDRDCSVSKIVNSEEFQSLRELIEKKPAETLGPGWASDMKFPILVKWLDCSKRLSLQVHPPKNIAKKLNGEPKTENWFVAHAESDAALFAGITKGTTKEIFEEAIKDGIAEKFCHKQNTKKGDSLLVESGRIHAIDAGNLILEIQQNSDTTYRVFDWGRTGLNGKPRELHLTESLECIDFNDFEPSVLSTSDKEGIEVIAACEQFRIRRFNTNSKGLHHLKNVDEDCLLIHSIAGNIEVNDETLLPGEHALVPYSKACSVFSPETSTFITTDNFIHTHSKCNLN